MMKICLESLPCPRCGQCQNCQENHPDRLEVCPSCLRPNTTYLCECGQIICQDCESYHVCELP